jgi:hypothetical protein
VKQYSPNTPVICNLMGAATPGMAFVISQQGAKLVHLGLCLVEALLMGQHVPDLDGHIGRGQGINRLTQKGM